MKNINIDKKQSIGSSILLVVATVLMTGCDFGAKNNPQAVTKSQSLLAKQLKIPSPSYLLEATDNRYPTAEQWLIIGVINFESKNYARALRAANEAINLDSELAEARELAMLSAVKVTESRIESYNDNELMNSNDKDRLKKTFANITTLINISD